MKSPFLFLFLLAFALGLGQPQQALAQRTVKRDSLMTISMFSAGVGFASPGGDLAKRFGGSMEVGGSFMVKTRSKWLFSLEGSYLFGERVKERILDSLRTSEGFVLGSNGRPAAIRTSMRASKLPVVKVGRVFGSPDEGGRAGVNSGWFVTVGVGLLQHKIKIEDESRTVVELEGGYEKMYDKLSNGLAVVENVGYLYLDKRRRINFFASVEFMQAFTQSRRSYDINAGGKDTTKRQDMLNGIKFGWIIPIYKKLPQEYYYY